MLSKIAKGFKFSKPGSNVLTFHGPVLLDEQTLFLVHNGHTWDSAGTSTAMFGLLGALIHHFATRKKTIPYPYPTTPYPELRHKLEHAYKIGNVKDTAVVTQIPKTDIKGFKTGMLKHTELFYADGSITLYGMSGDVRALFEEHGIPESAG